MMKLAFIGGGNMATALISGLVQAPSPPQYIHVIDPSEAVRSRLDDVPKVKTFEAISGAIRDTQAIVLAVKPFVMSSVLEELEGELDSRQLVISVAAGITIDHIRQVLGEDQPVIRAMPNTPALIGLGMTGLFAAETCTESQRSLAEHIMSASGAAIWVDEEHLINVVTGISGSGPAYFYLMIEALTAAACELGLSEGQAARFAVQTARGAGEMAARAESDVAGLRQAVTTPGGTTAAAIDEFKANGFEHTVLRAVRAAVKRSEELSEPGD